MGILGWLVLGLIAGVVARAILPGRYPGGLVVATIMGVVGALVGGFLGQALFGVEMIDEFFDLSTWLTSIVGAVIVNGSERRLSRNANWTDKNCCCCRRVRAAP